MTARQAHRVAMRMAYEAVQKAVDCGGDEMGLDVDGQRKVDAALDRIAQAMYERCEKLTAICRCGHSESSHGHRGDKPGCLYCHAGRCNEFVERESS